MSPVGHTIEFPRKDNIYKGKESLPYDEAHSIIWKDRPVNERLEAFKEWAAYAFIGLMVGATAFVMKVIEEELLILGVHLTNGILGGQDQNIA